MVASFMDLKNKYGDFTGTYKGKEVNMKSPVNKYGWSGPHLLASFICLKPKGVNMATLHAWTHPIL